MEALFKESDFDLIAKYAGKKVKEEPEAHSKLRAVYDKLGLVMQELKKCGYLTDIRRDPRTRANTYAKYHWGRVYPKQSKLQAACHDKVFFLVGTVGDCIRIHIDSYHSKGHKVDTETKEKIKKDTWLEIPKAEASTYTCEDLVKKVEDYIHENWVAFNQFAREFGIKDSIEILKESGY